MADMEETLLMAGMEETLLKNPEDEMEAQGIRALSRGLMFRIGRDEYLFPPSYFAEAAFALIAPRVKGDAFNALVRRIQESRGEAERYPKIAAWIEQVQKKGRSYWGFAREETPGLEKRVDFKGLVFDIQHTDVEPVTGLNVGDTWRNYPVVHADSYGRAVIEKDGRRVLAHTHGYSRNLALADFMRKLPGDKGTLGIVGQETHRAAFNMRVRTRRRGRLPTTLSYWLAPFSMPFYDRKQGLDYRFDIDPQADFEAYLGNRGWLWVPEDVDILNRLERTQLPSSQGSRTNVIGFHSAVVLTRMSLEKRKSRDERKITFLPVHEDCGVVMPYQFAHLLLGPEAVENPGMIFEPVVMLYGLQETYATTDDWLLQQRENIFSEQGQQSYSMGHATLELVLSQRGMSRRETRRILKNEHYALVEKGFRFQGYATDFNEHPDLRCDGVVHVHPQNGRVAYLLYNKTIELPLVHELHFGQSGADVLFGEARENSRLPLSSEINPLQRLGERFQGREYRTPREYQGVLRLPSSLSEDEQGLYARWLGKAI